MCEYNFDNSGGELKALASDDASKMNRSRRTKSSNWSFGQYLQNNRKHPVTFWYGSFATKRKEYGYQIAYERTFRPVGQTVWTETITEKIILYVESGQQGMRIIVNKDRIPMFSLVYV